MVTSTRALCVKPSDGSKVLTTMRRASESYGVDRRWPTDPSRSFVYEKIPFSVPRISVSPVPFVYYSSSAIKFQTNRDAAHAPAHYRSTADADATENCASAKDNSFDHVANPHQANEHTSVERAPCEQRSAAISNAIVNAAAGR
jgi:hypothetical protein